MNSCFSKESEEIKKFYNLLNTNHQNPNFIATVAAAVAAAAAVSSSSGANIDLFNPQANYLHQLQQAFINSSNSLSKSESFPVIAYQNNYSSVKGDDQHKHEVLGKSKNENIENKTVHVEKIRDSPKKKTLDHEDTKVMMPLDENNNNENCNCSNEPEKVSEENKGKSNSEYRNKVKSRHSHHHHHHHHHPHNSHQHSQQRTSYKNRNAEDLKLNSSISSSLISTSSCSPLFSSASSSSSSSSASSVTSSAPSSPSFSTSPQPTIKVEPDEQSTHKSLVEEKHFFASKIPNKSEQQLNSQPRNDTNNEESNKVQFNNKPGFRNNLTQSISVPKLHETKKSANLLDDFSLNSSGFKQGPKSSQKANTAAPTFMPPTPSNASSSSNALSNEVKQRLKNLILQKLDRNKQTTKGQATNDSRQLTYQQQINGQDQEKQMNYHQAQFKANQHQMDLSSHHLHHLSHLQHNHMSPQGHQQLQQQNLQFYGGANEVDENNLRRTTSEPNLKVKSALKDRLLEKRNLLNPFIAMKRGAPNHQQYLQDKSGKIKTKSPMGSLSSIHVPPFNFPHQNSLENIYNKELMNSQQNAALALIGLSSNESLNHKESQAQMESAYIAATLHQIALQQQQQQQLMANQSNSTNFLESLALAAAMVNQQSLSQYNLGSYSNMVPDKLTSLSFPALPVCAPTKPAPHLHPIPKFGHMAHVEEENEMLLANELKNAAKLNDSQTSLLFGDLKEKRIEQSCSDDDEDDEDSFNAQQQSLFVKHQEFEEHRRQSQYHHNKASFFSDPYLLKSIETTSISSHANINSLANKGGIKPSTSNSQIKRKMGGDKKTSSSNINNNALAMECCLGDERVYRYTTGIVYDKAMLKHECTCNNPANHLETADRIQSIWSRFKSLDLIDECEVVESKMASISDLLTCHSEQYSLIFGSDLEMRPKLPKEFLQQYMMNVCLAPCRGFALAYDQDNSWNEEHTPVACRVAIGSTYELASLVWAGKLKNGFALVRPPGSHAEFNKPL